ncbi:TylF/MycF family methyltransferase [Pelagibacteraceae bacterium]|nr:TylF/MycF family methyltransferase [Pelagibacteraceae bacterium]
MLKKIIKENLKKFIFKYTKIGSPTYSYNLDPLQLAEIINSLEKVKNIKGTICEVGVARGMTTRFICEYLENGDEQPEFYCVDTFNSFAKEDIQYEVEKRKKTKSELIGFSYNDFEKWKKNFKQFSFVKAIKKDIKNFDFGEIRPIKFALLDVDLYLPTLSALNNLKNNMAKGSILMVDDVSKDNSWDGANQAFYEFVKQHSLKFKLIGKKCGIIVF